NDPGRESPVGTHGNPGSPDGVRPLDPSTWPAASLRLGPCGASGDLVFPSQTEKIMLNTTPLRFGSAELANDSVGCSIRNPASPPVSTVAARPGGSQGP